MEMTARREFRHRQLGNEALDQYGLSALNPNIHVTLGASIYAEILGVAEQAEADRVGVGSHRPAMKDYLLGTNTARVVRHVPCSVLVARE